MSHNFYSIFLLFDQLKATKKELKGKIDFLQMENHNLQCQIQLLSAQLEQQLLITKQLTTTCLAGSSIVPNVSKPKENVVQILEKRIAAEKSDDGVRQLYEMITRIFLFFRS